MELRRSRFAWAVAAGTVAATIWSAQAEAQVPVEDAAANASLAQTVANGLRSIGQAAQQITQLTQLVNFGSLATTILGDTVSPDLANLFQQARNAYAQTNSAYSSVLAVPANIDRELASTVLPPPGGWESLTLEQMMARADAIRRLTQSTAAANVSSNAKALQRQVELQPTLDRARNLHRGAVGELSALQALGEQGSVSLLMGDQLLQNFLQYAAAEDQERAERKALDDATAAINDRGIQAMRDRIAQGAARPQTRPSSFH